MTVLRVVDLFAGAGGTSCGVAQAAEAFGRSLELVAVNHWQTAVDTHATNHPWAQHHCAEIDSLDPRKLVRGRLDLLVASPECTHHSTARGGRPMSDQSRATAWCVVRWADALQPRVVLVENVPEFRTWGPLTTRGRPMKSRAGETFEAWLSALRSLGYRTSARILNAADYGDPTTRRRLFVLAWRGRQAAPWADTTHAPRGETDLFGARAPWRAAREIIDWTLVGQSIFERKRPLAEKTLARIAEGLRRFGGAAAEPFLMHLTHGGRVRSLDDPLPTITAANRGELGVIEPFLLGQQSGSVPRLVTEPTPTLAAKGAVSLVEPFLVRYHGTGGAESVDRPLPTITARDRFGLVQPAQLDIRFRMLQPHELAAAMSFPDGYRFCGNRGEVVRQIGNAVPVSTARALAAGILGQCVTTRRSA